MISEKIKKTASAVKNERTSFIARGIAYFFIAFALSAGSVFGELHPFGAAFCAVSKKKHFLFSAAGAIAGLLIYGIDENIIRYITAVIICAIGAFGIASFDLNGKAVICVFVSFFSSIVTGIVLDFKIHAAEAQILLTIGEAILAGGSAYFFHRAINSSYKRLRFKALPIGDISCIVISASIVLMNLSKIKILTISPARLLCSFAVLTAICYFGEMLGLTLSLAFGFSLSIGQEEMLFLIGAMAFSALTASLFSSLGIFATGGAYLISYSFFCIASQSSDALPLFIESGIGTLGFVLLPNKVCEKLEALSGKDQSIAFDGSLRQTLVLKLRFAASAMAAISESVEQVRDRINEITRRENDLHKEEISEEEYIQKEIILEKTNQIRMVASDQFFGVSGMLEDLAFEFDEAEIFDSAASAKIRRLLGEFEIFPQSISAIEDKYGRMRVEILTNNDSSGLDNPKLCSEIGKICSRYFDSGKITNFRNECMLSFFEKANYRLDIGFAQHCAEGKLCGDTIKIVNDNKGHTILIISDGMGKGSRAALDGAMGAGLLSKLINAGFGFDSALKVVNCALLVKSNDESLATLDIANLDLFTGKCEFFKAGAPASYIIKNSSITKCELSSMPAGILRGIEFAKRTAVLRPDNSIILLSDGISDIGDEELYKIIYETEGLSTQSAADYIIDEALKRRKEKIDDMSVIYARLEQN